MYKITTPQYQKILVESFFSYETGHRGPVHIRPAPDQIYPQELFVECSRKMKEDYPVGTTFLLNVRQKQTPYGRDHLYSNPRDPVIVISLGGNLTKEQPESLSTGRKTAAKKQHNTVKTLLSRPIGNRKPESTISEVTEFQRDDLVKAWVLQQANGKCECCKGSSPFRAVNGLPYLEVHHVRHLADGGSDTPENAVALCPNCHRELHYGANAKTMLALLYKRVKRLVYE